jgi:hypothetical protein
LNCIDFVFSDHVTYQHSYQQRLVFTTTEASEAAVFTSARQIYFCAFVMLRCQSPPFASTIFRTPAVECTYCKRAIVWHHHRDAIKRAETLNKPEQDKNKHENGPRFRKPNQTRAARRRRELIAGLAADLGRSPNTMEAALIEQAADLIIARDVATAAANSTVMLKISGQITRTLSALRGKSSNLQPSGRTLADHIAAKRAVKPAARVSDEAA